MGEKVTGVSSRHIPSGTLYSLGSKGNGQFAVNKAHLNRGRVTVIRREGYPNVSFRRGPVTASGDKVAFFDVKGDTPSRYHIVSLKDGTPTPVKESFGRGFFRCDFTGFSRQERYLSFSWFVQNTEGKYGGTGIYDSVSQQTWDGEGAQLATWSVSGNHLVFIRYFLNGKYLGRGDDGRRLYRFFDRPLPAVLNDIHFYAKDARSLSRPTAERIAEAQAVRLVGEWYRPLVKYAVEKGIDPYDGSNVPGPNRVVPGNRGVLLIDTHNNLLDHNLAIHPDDLDLAWRTAYIDVKGHSLLYKPCPPIEPMSWSRDGERVYGFTKTSSTHIVESGDESPFICFWVRSGRYAELSLPKGIGAFVAFLED